MKTPPSRKTVSTCLMGAVLMAAGTAALTAQENQIEARPLTHQEIADYGLPEGTRPSGGLLTVGVGQPVYLEAQLAIDDDAAANVAGVTWALTLKPATSTNVLEPSPLTAEVPIYEPRSRLDFVIAGGADAGRTMLVPTTNGEYTVTATVMVNGGDDIVLSCNVRASLYSATIGAGATTCLYCHDGSVGSDQSGWEQTGHASFFTRAIDGIESAHYNSGCIDCHVVGFDTNPLAVNGGFDDVAAQVGWTFPTVLTNGNWAAMPAALKNVSNIQCENCHGAALDHASALGNTNATFWPRISVNYNSGDCAQCHSEEPYHIYPIEWENSKHAIAVREDGDCAGCHQGIGFIDRMDGEPLRDEYSAINCATCHDPHSPENPHQLRSLADVTLMDSSRPGGNTVVTQGGNGKLCMQCHISRRDAVSYVNGNVNNRFGPHHGPQTDMLVGANAITYGKEIPSSAHYTAVGDTCVTCHMHENADPAIGGHSLWMEGNGVDNVAACTECHGDITTFDFPRQDYDGDGTIEGVQTEVKGLMEQLAMLLPPVGQPTVDDYGSYTELKQKQGLYNYLFVEEDGSFGVHNLTYAVGILKASIAALDPDTDKDGLLDEWELAELGTLSYNGQDDPDNDGLNNALEAANVWGTMTSNPKLADSDGDGFSDLAELRAGSNPVDPNDKPGFFVQMMPAGEVQFQSEMGKTYVIQMLSELTTSWQTVTTNMPGTGDPISYLVSYQDGGSQAFYRVEEIQAP